MIHTILVDDEPLARKKLRSFLEQDGEVEIVAECANGLEAVAAVQERKPDLLFLDIQMPEMDGFGVLQALGAENMPLTVFVTAYDQYAIPAFEAQALDYLLKPYNQERFEKTLKRAKAALRQKPPEDVTQQLQSLIEAVQGRKNYLDRIVVKSTNRIYFIRAEEIDWIEASGNYVEIHTGPDTHLIRETMSRLEEQLDPARFFRIHRSYLVNLDRVKEVQPYFNGESIVIMRSGKEIPMSRNYREKFNQKMGI